jgi:hypothetical protein
MSKFFGISLTICFLLIGTAVDADEAEWILTGQVLHDNGEPARDFEVATFWSANGQQWNDDGTFPKLDTDKAISEWWNDEGELAPHPRRRARVYDKGRFEIAHESKGTVTDARVVLAVNKQRTLGGFVYAMRDAKQPITIVLGPLVRVHGQIRCAGVIPEWTYACVFPGNVMEPPD